MNRQLIGENPNTTFYDANQSVAGIEMHELNHTTNSTYRAGYVNLDDVDDNVYYADKESQKRYQNVSNEDPYSNYGQEKKQNNVQLNNQNQGQNLINKNGYVGTWGQQEQQQVQHPQQQIINQQIGYPNLDQRNPVDKNNQQLIMQQQPYLQNQQFAQKQIQGVPPVHSTQMNPAYNQQQAQYQASTFGLGQMSSQEYQQQLQLQQKIYEDIQRSRMAAGQNQNQGIRQPNLPPNYPQQIPQQNPNQIQSQMPIQRPPQPQMVPQQMIAKVDVKCIYCYVAQRIPMTSKKFQCFNCQKIQDSNPTIPIYSMFSCGKCQARVLYEPGVSDLICCTRCQTINKVSMDANLLKKQMSSQLSKILLNLPPVQEQQKNLNEKPKDELTEDEIKIIEKQFSEINVKKEDKDPRKESFDVNQVQDEQFVELQKKQLEQIELMKEQQQLLQQQIEQKQKAIKQQSVLFSQNQALNSAQTQNNVNQNASKYPILSKEDNQLTPQANQVSNQKDLLDLPQQPQQQQQTIQPESLAQQISNFNNQNQIVQSESVFADQSQSQQKQNDLLDNNTSLQQNQVNNNSNNQQQLQQQMLYQQQQQQYQLQQQQQQQQYYQQQQQQQNQNQQQQQLQEEQQVQRNDRGYSIFEEHQVCNALL